MQYKKPLRHYNVICHILKQSKQVSWNVPKMEYGALFKVSHWKVSTPGTVNVTQ